MLKKFTFWLTLFALVVCLLNYAGTDRNSLFLYFISIPVWVIEIFRDIHSLDPIVVYLATILSWTAIGLFIDRMLLKKKKGEIRS